jgi:hypothetical protein
MASKLKTIVSISTRTEGVKKNYYREVTIYAKPTKVWEALCSGCFSVLDVDIREIRADRLRKGKKR